MSIEKIAPELRTSDVFHHIDMGFLNRRLAISALPPTVRQKYIERQKPGTDHMTVLSNDHLLVTILLDVCVALEVPTLLQALTLGKPTHMFKSTERLKACPGVYNDKRVTHDVFLDLDLGKPVKIAYHTSHLVSDTGTMTLAEGYEAGYVQSVVGLVHDRGEHWEIEPIVIGAPWLDHPRNGESEVLQRLMWIGYEYGEILPEDIEQFSRSVEVKVESAAEWMDAMQTVPEAKVKETFAALLNEPSKKDWGGEENDHFSSNVTVAGRRRTAAFLLKGPTNFREMTVAMCGKNGDQIYRLVNSGADISVVQHSHLIGAPVRATLRSMTVTPGNPRKYCLIDGQATFRILKGYGAL